MLLYTGNHNYMKRKFLSKGYKSFCPDRKGFTFIITIQPLIARNKSSSTKYIVNVTFYPFFYCFDWSHKSRFETNNSDSYSMKLVRLFFVNISSRTWCYYKYLDYCPPSRSRTYNLVITADPSYLHWYIW